MPKLIAITKSLAGLSFELSATPAIVGRAQGTTLQIIEPSVSGRHCEVRLRGDEIVVRDLKSTNGTFINGQRILEAVLKPGQILGVGQVDFRLEASTTAPAAFQPLVNPTSGKKSESIIPKFRKVPKIVIPDEQRLMTQPIGPQNSGIILAKSGDTPESTPAKKHRVLFVDDNQAFLDTISKLYAVLGKGACETECATTVAQVFTILEQRPVNLVVVDISMPVIDGIHLLDILNRRYPNVRKAVLTGNVTESNRAACLANGAEMVLQKPTSTEGMKAVFTVLSELILLPQQREGFSGVLQQVGLQDVIQMVCLGRNSLILDVRNQQARGQIFIESGSIIHASAGNLTGEKAFYKLLSLNGGEFQLQSFKQPPSHTVNGQWEFLLMEAARVHDENAANATEKIAPVTAKPLAAKPVPPEQSPAPASTGAESHGHGEDFVVVATYDGQEGQWSPIAGQKIEDQKEE
jgi:CheY-like chemotaxis protein